MLNSIELQVISKLLTSQSDSEIDRLCSYDTSYYAVFKDHIKFILDHKDKYGDVPDVFTFQAQFEDITLVDVDEPIEYLEESLKKNKQHILFLETFNKLTDLGSEDVSVAWEYLSSQCEKAEQLSSSQPMNIVKDAAVRSDQILKFNSQSRIPTGFKELDKLMYGGLSTVEELCVIVARTNAGKAQPLWSKVLTPSGWKQMGDIHVGDIVVGKNNDNGRVVQIFPQGIKDYYRVNFDDGTSVECCDDHLWEVLDTKRRIRENAHYEEHLVLCTKDIRNHLNNRYSVDYTEPIEFESDFDENSELDAYLLGVILGDGCTRDNRVVITSENVEIWDNLTDILQRYGCTTSGKLNNAIRGIEYNNNFVRSKIIEYGLMNVRSVDKFIPKQYFQAPVHVRKALLAGLLDTDGYALKNTSLFDFDTASEQLAYDFVELARSLGISVTLYDRQESYYTDKTGSRHIGSGTRHIRCRSVFNPFTIPCKSSRWYRRLKPYKRSMPKRHCKMIQSIEYIGKTECQCILLDNESHTYITDGYTVTHNTWVTTKMMESAQANGFPVLYYSPEMRSSFIGTRFDTWRGHFRNSEIFRGQYSEEYKEYLKELVKQETGAYVVEDSDMSEGRTTVRGLESLVKKNHIKLLIIDGLSYIQGSGGGNVETHIKYRDICNDLFRLSKTYECAVVVSVQANRDTRDNRDEKGEPFPNIYNIAESDHPARIATQVFAIRQIFDKHMLEIRLEKSRTAKNDKPVFSYVWDPNTGTTELIEDDSNLVASTSTVASPTISSTIVQPDISQVSSTVADLIADDDDYDDIEF